MGTIRFGPARLPSHESPEAAVELLTERHYTACEIDFEGGFWMDWDYARRLRTLARRAGIALSVHAPIPAFLGHLGAAARSIGWRSACSTTPRELRPRAEHSQW